MPAIKDWVGVIIQVLAGFVVLYEYCLELVPVQTYAPVFPLTQLLPLPALILVQPIGGNDAPSKPSKKLNGKLVNGVAINGVAVAFKQYVTGVVTTGEGGNGFTTKLIVSLR